MGCFVDVIRGYKRYEKHCTRHIANHRKEKKEVVIHITHKEEEEITRLDTEGIVYIEYYANDS